MSSAHDGAPADPAHATIRYFFVVFRCQLTSIAFFEFQI
jgi:hypothetical protein